MTLDSPRAEPRAKPKVDIFGKKERQVDFDEDERHQPSAARDRRRFGEAKTGKEPQGRQAPGKQTTTGTEYNENHKK